MGEWIAEDDDWLTRANPTEGVDAELLTSALAPGFSGPAARGGG